MNHPEVVTLYVIDDHLIGRIIWLLYRSWFVGHSTFILPAFGLEATSQTGAVNDAKGRNCRNSQNAKKPHIVKTVATVVNLGCGGLLHHKSQSAGRQRGAGELCRAQAL
ncbi:hypothetical protein J8F10_24585 [Gemmata sp. G18]|uniref:Uncharacterized protein n=1 Tax=Gemmata palustris TaxID=2822762 RepID=A0ABS5BZW6_9BACT|nr:hypothetical protein [Gemmata palustris]MBP3958438.1 hypothetical protein [Gemmata palustris]